MPHTFNEAFAFNHLLTRDAAYRALLDSNRRKLHGAAADVLAQGIQYGTPEELPLLKRLVEHLSAAARWVEAHEHCCVLLLRRALLGRTVDWEETAQHAQWLWDQARQDQPALASRSAQLSNAWALYLAMTGRMDESQAYSKAALKLAQLAGDLAQQAAALVHSGIATHYSGSQLAARDLYQQALEIYRALDDCYGQLRCLNNIGLSLHEAGFSEEALPYLEAGMALTTEGAGHVMRSNIIVNRGVVLEELQRNDEARQCFEEALQLAQEIGDRSTEGMALGNLGEIAASQQNWDTARRHFIQALGLAREADSPRFIAWWTNKQAELEMNAGELERSWALCQQAQVLAQRTNDKVVECHVHLTSAEVLAVRNEAGEAERYLGFADAVATAIGYVDGERYLRAVHKIRQLIARIP